MTGIPFTPARMPTRRHDGWTPERQRAFIDALAELGLVAAAAEHVGMSRQAAYALRGRAGSESFAAAWDEAVAQGRANAALVGVHRATHGVVVPVFYRGRQVGERRVYDDRLLAAALRRSLPDRYGDLP